MPLGYITFTWIAFLIEILPSLKDSIFRQVTLLTWLNQAENRYSISCLTEWFALEKSIQVEKYYTATVSADIYISRSLTRASLKERK